MYINAEFVSMLQTHVIKRYIHRALLLLICLPLITSCFLSSNDAPPTLQVVGFSLPDGEQTIYEYHRFNYEIGIRANAGNAANTTVTANVFLVDSRLQRGDAIDDGDNACHVGSVEVTLEEPGEDVFVTDLAMPLSGCAVVTDETVPMSFAIYLDTNDRILRSEKLNAYNHFILTGAMSGDKKNQQCIGADGQPGCVLNVLVEPSPGIDLELENIELDSNVVLNYMRSTDVLTYDEMHRPNTIVTVELWVDGLSPEENDALVNGETAEIKFDIRPAGDSGEWAPLTILDTDKPALAPVGHRASAAIDEIRSGGENHFTHALFIESDTYTATGPGGYWDGKTNFELRACVQPSFNEADIPVEDESQNNCIVAPFFLTQRLDYNPDIYQEDVTPTPADFDGDGIVEAITQAGLTKKIEMSKGDVSPTRVSLSLENQAIFGIDGAYDSTGNLLEGRGVPFAKINSVLEANQSGWIDIELMHIGFSHTITHKDPVDGSSWSFARKYHPGAQLRIFGYRLVDLEGAIALTDGETLIIDNDRLQKLSLLFVKHDDEDSKKDDEISYAQQLCEKNGIPGLVVEITVNICAVGVVGINYSISIFSSASSSIAPFDTASSIAGLDVSIDPFAELDLIASAKVDLALIKAEIAATVALIKLHLTHQLPDGQYKAGAGFSLTSGALSESSILAAIGTEGVLEERVLDGKIILKAVVPSGIYFDGFFEPHVRTKTYSTRIYSWDGISISKQKLWNLERDDTVIADSI